MITSQETTPPYIGVGVHERESRLAIFEQWGSLLMEKRIPTSSLESFVSSLPGKKHVAIEAVGFIYPTGSPSFHVSVVDPGNARLIARSRLKHGRADAKALGELLKTNFLPTYQTREKRLLTKDRVRYGPRRGKLKGSISGS